MHVSDVCVCVCVNVSDMGVCVLEGELHRGRNWTVADKAEKKKSRVIYDLHLMQLRVSF